MVCSTLIQKILDMKFNNIIKTTAFSLAFVSLLAACSKDHGGTARADVDSDFSNKAILQVYNASVNTQRNFLYMDGGRLSGTSMTYTAASYLASGLMYAVPAGLHSFLIKDTLGSSTQPSLAFSQDFQANSRYSMFVYDTMKNIKQITVKDNIVIPDDTASMVRFANFRWSRTGTPVNVDVFSKIENANILTNVPYTTVTEFFARPSAVTDSLFVRETGTTTNLAAAGFTFRPKKSYTILYYGSDSWAKTITAYINN
jgi:hypothetical protein